MKYNSGTQKARQSGMITPKLSKHSRKQAKESNSETQFPAVKKKKVMKRTFLQKCNHYKENRNVAKDSEKVDSDMLIEFH